MLLIWLLSYWGEMAARVHDNSHSELFMNSISSQCNHSTYCIVSFCRVIILSTCHGIFLRMSCRGRAVVPAEAVLRVWQGHGEVPVHHFRYGRFTGSQVHTGTPRLGKQMPDGHSEGPRFIRTVKHGVRLNGFLSDRVSLWAGLDNHRGDTGVLAKNMQKPHILMMSLPADRVSQLTSRKKRSPGTDQTCTE